MCRFEPPSFHRQPSLYGHSPFYLFSETPAFGKTFWQYRPNEIPDKRKINSYGKIISLKIILIYLKNNTFISKTWLRFNP